MSLLAAQRLLGGGHHGVGGSARHASYAASETASQPSESQLSIDSTAAGGAGALSVRKSLFGVHQREGDHRAVVLRVAEHTQQLTEQGSLIKRLEAMVAQSVEAQAKLSRELDEWKRAPEMMQTLVAGLRQQLQEVQASQAETTRAMINTEFASIRQSLLTSSVDRTRYEPEYPHAEYALYSRSSTPIRHASHHRHPQQQPYTHQHHHAPTAAALLQHELQLQHQGLPPPLPQNGCCTSQHQHQHQLHEPPPQQHHHSDREYQSPTPRHAPPSRPGTVARKRRLELDDSELQPYPQHVRHRDHGLASSREDARMENGEEEEEEEGGSGDAEDGPAEAFDLFGDEGLGAPPAEEEGGDSARIATSVRSAPAASVRCAAAASPPPQPCASAAAATAAASTPPQPTGAGGAAGARLSPSPSSSHYTPLSADFTTGAPACVDSPFAATVEAAGGASALGDRRRSSARRVVSDSPALPLAIALFATSGGGGRALPSTVPGVQRHTAPTDEERRDYRLSEGSRARALQMMRTGA